MSKSIQNEHFEPMEGSRLVLMKLKKAFEVGVTTVPGLLLSALRDNVHGRVSWLASCHRLRVGPNRWGLRSEGKISFSTLQESERAPDFFDFASVEFIELSLPEV